MDRSEFEAESLRDGYELREGEIRPDQHRSAHIHPFDARLFVLDGAMTFVCGTKRVDYKPSDVCDVPAGTLHEEHTKADGARFLAARSVSAGEAAQ